MTGSFSECFIKSTKVWILFPVEKLSNFSKARVSLVFKKSICFDRTVIKSLANLYGTSQFYKSKAIDITHLRSINCEDEDPYVFTFFHDCQVLLIKKYLSKTFCTFLSIWSPSAVVPVGLYLAQITPNVVLPCREDWFQISVFWYEISAKSFAQCIHNYLQVCWALEFQAAMHTWRVFTHRRNAFNYAMTHIHNFQSNWRILSCTLVRK